MNYYWIVGITIAVVVLLCVLVCYMEDEYFSSSYDTYESENTLNKTPTEVLTYPEQKPDQYSGRALDVSHSYEDGWSASNSMLRTPMRDHTAVSFNAPDFIPPSTSQGETGSVVNRLGDQYAYVKNGRPKYSIASLLPTTEANIFHGRRAFD